MALEERQLIASTDLMKWPLSENSSFFINKERAFRTLSRGGLKKTEMSQTTDDRIHLLVYTSQYSGTPDTIDEDLNAILGNAQRNNVRDEITGVLFYQSGRFLQFIEGPEKSARDLLSRISGDRRHGAVEILFDEQISERGFRNWAMDSFNLTKQEELGLELLKMIRDAYRRNFVTYTDTLVGIYKGFVEQQRQIY